MAGDTKPLLAIDVLDLLKVWGGVGADGMDKQTRAAKSLIDQATAAVTDLAKKTAPKTGMSDVMMAMLNRQHSSEPGPGPAPALPPTSTLTR